jgi:hypothetical protein
VEEGDGADVCDAIAMRGGIDDDDQKRNLDENKKAFVPKRYKGFCELEKLLPEF